LRAYKAQYILIKQVESRGYAIIFKVVVFLCAGVGLEVSDPSKISI